VDLCYLPLLWQDCARSLASWLHGRHAWRLAVLLCGALFAKGRRTGTRSANHVLDRLSKLAVRPYRWEEPPCRLRPDPAADPW
jgi:hypothetical protein